MPTTNDPSMFPPTPPGALPRSVPVWEAAAMGHAAILAHQGGWDEMLLVATPIALLVGLLWVANKRADRMEAGHGPGSTTPARKDGAAPEDRPGAPEEP